MVLVGLGVDRLCRRSFACHFLVDGGVKDLGVEDCGATRQTATIRRDCLSRWFA
jgi:hypothetical protein